MSARAYNPNTHRPTAVWRTLEATPRYMEVLGRVAVDERMLLCRLEPERQHVWLEPLQGRVYVGGRWTCNAQCVRPAGQPGCAEGPELGGGAGPL